MAKYKNCSGLLIMRKYKSKPQQDITSSSSGNLLLTQASQPKKTSIGQECWNPYTLLVGMQSDKPVYKTVWGFLKKLKIGFGNLAYGIYLIHLK
jgi:hypothetical protein